MYFRIKKIILPRASLIILVVLLYTVGGNSRERLIIDLEPSRTAAEIYDNSYRGFRLTHTLSSISFSDVITRKGEFLKIMSVGDGSSAEYGTPMLPVVSRLIEIPDGAEVKLRVLSYKENLIDLKDYGVSNAIIPRQPSLSKSASGDNKEFFYREDIYGLDIFFGEEELVVVQELGIMRGKRIGRLSISPIQYNPAKNRLRVLSEINIEISFVTGKDYGSAENRAYTSSLYKQIFSERIFNYIEDSRKTYSEDGPVSFIILSHPMFQEDLREFVEWKTKKGFNIIELYRGVGGVGDTPAEMRDTLAGIYHAATPGNPPPLFLLIVGDHEQVPAFQSSGHVTDLYYAEYDGDGDYFPDLFYGRFSANNSEELIPQIEKTLMYEQYLFAETAWLNEAVLIAGVDSRYAAIHGNGQINYATENYFNEDYGITSNAYLVPHATGVAAEINNRISAGAAFVNYTGHGFPYRWDNPRFSVDDIPSLQNYGKFPLMIGNACETNRFNLYECIGEALLRADGKGAIGYIGASNDSYWDEDFYWAVGVGPITANPGYNETGPGMYDRLFNFGGEPLTDWYVTQGQVQQAGNLAVSESSTRRVKYYWEIYHLMGDPSLMIYFSEPDPLDPDYQKVLSLDASELVVRTEPYTYVALSGNNTLIDAKYAGSNGIARLVFDSLQEDIDYSLVATRESRQPYTGSVRIAPGDRPFVSLETFSINDSLNNNNGIAESGERVFIDMVVKNSGGLATGNLKLSLHNQSDHINLYDDVYEINTLAPDEEFEVEGVFGFEVSREVPDGELLFMTLEIYNDDSLAWSSNFTVGLAAPEIEILRTVVDDSAENNPNGYLMAGETALLSVEFTNSGSALIYDAGVWVEDSSGGLIFNPVSQDKDTVNPGDTIQYLFEVTAHSEIVYGTILSPRLVVSSTGYYSSVPFTLPVNTIYEDFVDGSFSRRPWETDPGTGWFFTSESYSGSFSVRSGEIGHNMTSELSIKMEVSEEGSISFFRKISSERSYDFLEFYIDDTRIDRWSGSSVWLPEEFPVEPGERVFRWVYRKDGSVSEGYDAAWIDNIIFPPGRLVPVFFSEATIDVGIGELISPVSGEWIDSEQSVTVMIKNYGNYPVDSFGAAFELNGIKHVNDIVSTVLNPGASLEYTFNEMVDLSEPGEYWLKVYTIHESDTIGYNDTLYTVIHVPEIYDIMLTGLLHPASGMDMANDEIIEVELLNIGNVSLTGFEVRYIVNDSEPVAEIFDDIVMPGDITLYSFKQVADLSLPGEHHLTICVVLDHDKKAIHDSIHVLIENIVTTTVLPSSLRNNITIYPNPFDNDLFIKLDFIPRESVFIRLLSPAGRLLRQVQYHKQMYGYLFKIDGKDIPRGIYHLEVTVGERREVFMIFRH